MSGQKVKARLQIQILNICALTNPRKQEVRSNRQGNAKSFEMGQGRPLGKKKCRKNRPPL
jgi:hypothetical protein